MTRLLRAFGVGVTGTVPSAAPSLYPDVVKADSPAAYWRLGEASGTAAADSSGNGHAGTYVSATLGAAGAVAGDTDKAVTLNGTSGYVNAGNLGVGGSATFTAEAWVKTATTQAYKRIVGEGSTSTTNPEWLLGTDSGGTKARFVVRDNAATPVLMDLAGTKTITDNKWHHLVAVRSGSTFRLYVDGVLDASKTSTVGSGSLMPLNTTTVGVLKQSTLNGYFAGTVDEVALYPAALSAARVGAHYQSAVPPVNSAVPLVSGTATVGQALTATNGTWAGGPTGYSYEWQRCDTAGGNCAATGGTAAG